MLASSRSNHSRKAWGKRSCIEQAISPAGIGRLCLAGGLAAPAAKRQLPDVLLLATNGNRRPVAAVQFFYRSTSGFRFQRPFTPCGHWQDLGDSGKWKFAEKSQLERQLSEYTSLLHLRYLPLLLLASLASMSQIASSSAELAITAPDAMCDPLE